MEGQILCRHVPSFRPAFSTIPIQSTIYSHPLDLTLQLFHSSLLHYLDDFFTASAPASQECSNSLSAMLSLCQKINAPVKPSKIEGPTTHLIFLGILIDTSTMTASITEERKQDLISSLQSMLQHSKCTKRQLLSLIG